MKAFKITSILLLLISSIAFAGPKEDLLKLDHQPSVSEIKAAFGGNLPEQNPFGTANASIQDLIKSNIPFVIASFEKSFPGATFAPLGRDSVFLGDVIDSFYQSLGQSRVVRVSASGDSRTGNDQDYVDFLKERGLDINHLKENPAFVMFDQTNFQASSQSVSYLNAIYNLCARTPGCDLELLVEKFNFLNTGFTHNMYAQNALNETTSVPAFLEAQKKQAAQHKRLGAIMSILVAHDLVYTKEYHEKFSKFHKVDGKVVTAAGRMNADGIRLQILADVFETIKTVSTPTFKEQVNLEAKKLSYEFPNERITQPKKIDAIRAKFVSPEVVIARKNQAAMDRISVLLSTGASGKDFKAALEKEFATLQNGPGVAALRLDIWLKAVKQNPANREFLSDELISFLHQNPINDEASTNRFRDLLKRNAVLSQIFEEEIPKKIHTSLAAWQKNVFIQAYSAVHGVSLQQAHLTLYQFQLQEIETSLREKLRTKVVDINELNQIVWTPVQPVVKVAPFGGHLFYAKMLSMAFEKGAVTEEMVTSSFEAVVHHWDETEPNQAKELVDLLNRSSLFRKVFDQVLVRYTDGSKNPDVHLPKFLRLSAALTAANPNHTSFTHRLSELTPKNSLPAPGAQTHEQQLAALTNPQQIVNAIGNLTKNSTEASKEIMRLTNLMAEQRKITRNEIVDLLLPLVTAANMKEASERHKMIQDINQYPLLKREVDSVFARLRVNQQLFSHVKIQFELFYTEWAKISVESYRKNYLRGRMLDPLSKGLTSEQMMAQLPGMVSTLENPERPLDQVQVWRGIIEISQELLSKKMITRLDLARVLVDRVWKQADDQSSSIKKLLKDNSELRSIWENEGLEYLITGYKIFQQPNAELSEVYAKLAKISPDELEKRLLRKNFEISVRENLNAQQLIQAARTSASRLSQNNADEGFMAELDLLHELLESKKITVDDFATALQQRPQGFESKEAAVLKKKAQSQTFTILLETLDKAPVLGAQSKSSEANLGFVINKLFSQSIRLLGPESIDLKKFLVQMEKSKRSGQLTNRDEFVIFHSLLNGHFELLKSALKESAYAKEVMLQEGPAFILDSMTAENRVNSVKETNQKYFEVMTSAEVGWKRNDLVKEIHRRLFADLREHPTKDHLIPTLDTGWSLWIDKASTEHADMAIVLSLMVEEEAKGLSHPESSEHFLIDSVIPYADLNSNETIDRIRLLLESSEKIRSAWMEEASLDRFRNANNRIVQIREAHRMRIEELPPGERPISLVDHVQLFKTGGTRWSGKELTPNAVVLKEIYEKAMAESPSLAAQEAIRRNLVQALLLGTKNYTLATNDSGNLLATLMAEAQEKDIKLLTELHQKYATDEVLRTIWAEARNQSVLNSSTKEIFKKVDISTVRRCVLAIQRKVSK